MFRNAFWVLLFISFHCLAENAVTQPPSPTELVASQTAVINDIEATSKTGGSDGSHLGENHL